MRKKNLGRINVGSDEWKAWVEDGHIVAHQHGKPRFVKALSLEEAVAHVVATGKDSVKPKKAFPYPEFRFLQS